jgi:hypothetical protein
VPSAPWMIHARARPRLAVQPAGRVVQAGRGQAGRRLGQAAPQTGDDQTALAPAAPGRPKLQ